jgi:hypothetical protein
MIMGMVAVLPGCLPRDPINRLMAEVPYETVESYMYRPIELPATAKPEQLFSALSKGGDLQGARILEVRPTHTRPHPQDKIPVQDFTAVLFGSVHGRKILLLQPQKLGWYHKVYDVK